jgi:imidazole glycerol-phosphate synthase subunit HisH
MIAIVDYGVGNTGSILNMLKKVGCTDAIVTNNKTELERADKYILPGVGAFDYAVTMMQQHSIQEILTPQVVEQGKPVLGICLGMQLLTKGSEEGTLEGLGWIDAYTCKFNLPGSSLKVPHMGWNEVEEVKEHALTAQLPAEKRFYFVHSYYVKCNDKNDELLTTNYGLNFTSALQHNNIMGVQFHPEKSHRFGMQVFKNYVAL